jgi:V/A-type H+/Na+-transporting ATPase subunit D
MLGAIKPTRSELLKLKKRIVLAKKGHELLKKKQDSLIIELFRLLREIREQQKDLRLKYASAVLQMNKARSLESDLRIKAAAIAVQETAPVDLGVKNIAGVKVPVLKHEERASPRYDSLLLSQTGGAYLDVLDLAMNLAAKETALRKLLLEIRKTKRRAHALEQIFIPELLAAKARITSELEERAREEFTRLKRRKQ